MLSQGMPIVDDKSLFHSKWPTEDFECYRLLTSTDNMRTSFARLHLLTVISFAVLLVFVACEKRCKGFIIVRADRTITPGSAYPVAVEPNRVGTYPANTKSGAGYFYDDVLECRVWLNPERGAAHLNGDEDYFVSFAQYEPAEAFSKATAGAEKPLVLVRQREWIAEPTPGTFHAEKGERITEWRVKWLAQSKREPNSISNFLVHPKSAPAETEEE